MGVAEKTKIVVVVIGLVTAVLLLAKAVIEFKTSPSQPVNQKISQITHGAGSHNVIADGDVNIGVVPAKTSEYSERKQDDE